MRARAFRQGWVPSGTRTATYLINQHAGLRTVPALIFTGDARRDIYQPFGILSIAGGTVDANNIWSAVTGTDYNLALMHGRPYERGIVAEWLRADGQPGFSEEAGLRLASSPFSRPRLKLQQTGLSPWTSTPFEKPSFNLFFRDSYDQSELDYPVFGPEYPVKSFDQLRHRAGKNDIVNPFIKDEFIRRTFIDMGHPVVRGTFNTLYVNGAYKGYYNTVERYRAPFFQAHYDSTADWDIRINDAVEDGDSAEWLAAIAAFNGNLSQQAVSDAALARIDVDEVIDYFLINIYTAQSDWPNNNWVAARERSDAGKYRLYLWDSEISFAQNANKPVGYDTIRNDLKDLTGSLPSFFRAIYSSAEVRLRFADRINRHFFNGGALDDRDPVNSRLVRRKNELGAMVRPLLEYTANQTFNDSFLTNWIQPATGRRKWLFDSNGTASDVSFRKHGLWPVTGPPSFSQHGGTIAAGQAITIAPGSGVPAGSPVYYTVDGSDPRSFAGAVSPSALTYAAPVVFSTAQGVLKARVRNAVSGEWSALTEALFFVETVPATSANLVVSQIQYHPPSLTEQETAAGFTDGELFEFLELQAVGAQNVDLSAVKFISGISFDFAASPRRALPPGGKALLVNNKAAFLLRYGSGPAALIAGEYLGKLANSGERLLLTGADGPDADQEPDVIHDFSYLDGSPWPEAADGNGPSLELREPALLPDHAVAANWSASAAWGGSPGGLSVPLDWNHWRLRYLSGGQGTATDDPDGDGLNNLLEFALGTLPDVANPADALELKIQEWNGVGYPTLTARLGRQAAGCSIRAQVSADLREWQDAVAWDESVTQPAETAFQVRRWRDTLPAGEGAARYFRLKVELP